MIKVSISSSTGGGSPPLYQNDQSYYQPTITGAVQWNGVEKCFQVSTGGGWQKIDNTVYLSISSEYEEIMNWVKARMEEDKKLEQLAKLYPAVADAKQHLDNVINLVK